MWALTRKKHEIWPRFRVFFVSEGAYAPSLAPLRRRGARRPLRTPNGIGTKFRSRILGTLDSLGRGYPRDTLWGLGRGSES